MTITPTDLTEIERKARAYQAEEAANPEAKTCHRPTPELVLRLIEHINYIDSQCLRNAKRAEEAWAERDELRAKVAELEAENARLRDQMQQMVVDSYVYRDRVRELEAIVALLPKACIEISQERARQKSVEGWSEFHDDRHKGQELTMAAACYTLPGIAKSTWPWDFRWWKPTTHRRNLIKAGALIVAEIERLDRIAAQAQKGGA